ncbi:MULTISPECIES: ABC transporter permease [Aeromonas]|mgnify:FL=1|uniref:ABC transporter permease n=1 Tax=Aeromonas TaxID=642 RepID=UPI00191D4F7A|nr:ABC transporter permease [Aeromonas dhakensis]MBL0602043.1 ABC transporter permease [Aeromonas dhakensis]
MTEYIEALRQWRVWLFLGLQDIKSRFRGSIVGPAWLLINQAALMLAVGVIFGHLFHQDMSNFLPFLAIGLVLWGSLTSSIIEGGSTFIIAEGYIKQFTFPKAVYVFRTLVSNIIVLLVGLIVFLVVAACYDKLTVVGVICSLPGMALFIIINLLTMVIFSHIGAGFKDIPHLFSSVMQVLFYVTPVMYTPEMLSARGLDFVYKYNPLYYAMEIVRYPFINGSLASYDVYLNAFIYAFSLFILAVIVVRKYSRQVVYML